MVGDRYATVDDIKRMPEVQKVIAETLRMWPAPPLFIRCATEAHPWPAAPLHLPISPQISPNLPIGGPVARGRNGRRGRLRARSRERPLHLDVQHGPLAAAVGGPGRLFDPQRWDRPFDNPDVKGWAGYDPAKRTGVDT